MDAVIDRKARNFVAPAPQMRTLDAEAAQYALPAPTYQRSATNAVTDVAQTALDVYRPQPVQAKRVQQVVDGAGWRMSTPEEKAVQRNDYLRTYLLISGGSAGGIVLVAYFNGAVGEGMGFGLWILLTAIFTAVLVNVYARNEVQHSPEGLARAAMGFDFAIAQYQAKGQYEILAAQANNMNVDARIREAKAQAELLRNLQTMQATQPVVQYQVQPAQPAAQRSVVTQPVRSAVIDDDELDAVSYDDAYAACAPYDVQVFEQPQHMNATALHAQPPTMYATLNAAAPREDAAVGHLAGWLRQLYATEGALDETGLIKVKVPWSGKASTPDAYKERMKEFVFVEPTPFEVVPGNRVRIRVDEYPDIDDALAWLAGCTEVA